MVSQENATLSDSLEEIFEIGLDHKKFSEAEIEDAKVNHTFNPIGTLSH